MITKVATPKESSIDTWGKGLEVNEQQVSQAIDTLSTGDFGQLAQSMAEQLPAPHKNAEMAVESPVTSASEMIFLPERMFHHQKLLEILMHQPMNYPIYQS